MAKEKANALEENADLEGEVEVEGAAEGYLEIFRRYGVDYIFCSPGSELVPFWEFLAKFNAQGKKPSYINVRHEGLVVSAAKGYAMATRKPQVVLLHVNAGLLHGAMELRSLYMDNIPMLVIAGQNVTHEREIWGGTGGAQFLAFTEVGGTQRLVQPFMKWSDAPDTNLNIHQILARAFTVSQAEPRGPVFLLLSRELMFEKTGKMKMPYKIHPPTSIQADPEAIKSLAELLVKADNPIIYTSCLGRNPKAVEHLVKLAELLSIPVFEKPSYMNFPTDHPLHLGYDISPYWKDADLILVIDSSGRPPWYPPSSVLSSSKAKTVFIDIDPVQLKYPYWGFPADLLITADSYLALPALIDRVEPMIALDQGRANEIEGRYGRWSVEHVKQRAAWKDEALKAKDQSPINSRWLCYNINEVLDENAVIVHETISYGRVIERYVERNRVKPGTQFEGAGAVNHVGLGQGLGVALGVKMANPEKTVVALEGDGSFDYNPVHTCYELASEYRLPFLTVVFDNQAYESMKGHSRYYPEGWSVRTKTYYGVYDAPKPDYVKLAQAFGGYAEAVENPAEVKPALLRVLSRVKKGEFALLDVMLPTP